MSSYSERMERERALLVRLAGAKSIQDWEAAWGEYEAAAGGPKPWRDASGCREALCYCHDPNSRRDVAATCGHCGCRWEKS